MGSSVGRNSDGNLDLERGRWWLNGLNAQIKVKKGRESRDNRGDDWGGKRRWGNQRRELHRVKGSQKNILRLLADTGI